MWTDFAEIRWPRVGDRVSYVTKTARRGWLETLNGEGIVAALGAGIHPHFTMDDGRHIHPTLGDTWKLVPTGENG